MLSTLEKTLLILSVPGLGVSRYWALLDVLGGVDAIYSAPAERLKQLINPALVEELDNIRQHSFHPARQALSKTREWCHENDTALITHLDDHYPDLLKEIPRAPPYLFVQGPLESLVLPQIAVVGSRSSSRNGMENAHSMAGALVDRGFAVTSGLALGIDSRAHCGALDNHGQTLAVIGTGIDSVYPYRNRALAARILDNGGAIISEFPLGAKAVPQNFPRRNRVISGLSLGTLVIEAAIKSGSLITARYATEQNREVFAMPGSLHSPLSKGCHALIKQGAVLVETVDDICAELRGFVTRSITPVVAVPCSEINDPVSPLSDQESMVLNKIEYDPTSLDSIAMLTGLSIDLLLANLMALELAGHIHNEAGNYSRVR